MSNSIFVYENNIEIYITDKVFYSDPVYIYSALASKARLYSSELDNDELYDIVKARYESTATQHFSMDYFDTLSDVYLLIKLRKILLGDEISDDEADVAHDIAKYLYRVKILDFV